MILLHFFMILLQIWLKSESDLTQKWVRSDSNLTQKSSSPINRLFRAPVEIGFGDSDRSRSSDSENALMSLRSLVVLEKSSPTSKWYFCVICTKISFVLGIRELENGLFYLLVIEDLLLIIICLVDIRFYISCILVVWDIGLDRSWIYLRLQR